MIELTKLNGNTLALNTDQIESIEMIPETKIMMMNGRYYIVQESVQEIIDRIADFNLRAGRTRVHTVVKREPQSTGE